MAGERSDETPVTDRARVGVPRPRLRRAAPRRAARRGVAGGDARARPAGGDDRPPARRRQSRPVRASAPGCPASRSTISRNMAPTSAPAAIRAFGLDAGPGVLALVAGGPAERAGLRADDILLAFDGRPPPRGAPGARRLVRPDGADPRRARRRLRRRRAPTLAVRRGGERLAVRVAAEQGCATRFQLIPARGLNARADGRYVQVTTAHRRLCRRRRRAGRGARPRIRPQCPRPPRPARRRPACSAASSAISAATRGASARPRSRRTGSASICWSGPATIPQAAVRFWSRFGRRGLNFLGSPTHPNWRQPDRA